MKFLHTAYIIPPGISSGSQASRLFRLACNILCLTDIQTNLSVPDSHVCDKFGGGNRAQNIPRQNKQAELAECEHTEKRSSIIQFMYTAPTDSFYVDLH